MRSGQTVRSRVFPLCLNYTLTLLYSDGRVKRVTFYLDPGAWKTDVREFYISTWKFI